MSCLTHSLVSLLFPWFLFLPLLIILSQGNVVSSRPAVLKMRVVPPAELTLPLASSKVLECEAGGNPSPTIHWLKNGKSLVVSYSLFFYHSCLLLVKWDILRCSFTMICNNVTDLFFSWNRIRTRFLPLKMRRILEWCLVLDPLDQDCIWTAFNLKMKPFIPV